MPDGVKVLRAYNVDIDFSILDEIDEKGFSAADILVAATQQCDAGNFQGSLFYVSHLDFNRPDVELDLPAKIVREWMTLAEMNTKVQAKKVFGPVDFRVRLEKWLV